ncbi:hypothetical protein HRE53_14340 [Acaryochloris sp. 'Moss Beach']|uniref:hypothetical protein n=1 Tax=Acaryochloris sp. 'Moss Beach' TaxID=2740837 RepID=UPI001F297EF4|nr:hypothetical protein [Acaryochloris sp. 'Moss Beach']UJB67837.1 hypothetical protein HRE53_14340 [Acaryochloris sp. 'Moss Beach']
MTRLNRRQFLLVTGTALLADPSKTLSQTPAAPPLSNQTQTVISRIQNIRFSTLGKIYHAANDQDRTGMGIWPCRTCKGPIKDCQEEDQRSEKIYLPFVMAPRRQTDMMVRQAYHLLPETIRRQTAFVLTDRLVQYPEDYLPYLQQKQQVVLVGSFVGIDNARSVAEFPQWLIQLHHLELLQVEICIDLIHSLGKPIVDIVYALGDSPSEFAPTFRQQMEAKLHRILDSKELKQLQRPLAWGADEVMLKAFARRLPPLRLKAHIASPNARHHYDGQATTAAILQLAMTEVGLTATEDDSFDIQALIFGRHPQASAFAYQPNDEQQQALDQQFAQRLQNVPTDLYSKTLIIDARIPNGAWDTQCIPPSADFLAFGSWGTFTNSCAQTLAIAKLLHYAQRPTIQRQLLLEAIAHDVFTIGYAEARHHNSPLRKQLQSVGLRYDDTCYTTAIEVEQVFEVINTSVNKRIVMVAPQLGPATFKVIPQLWRTFESQVCLEGSEGAIAGVYRTDLNPATFNPFQSISNVQKFTLTELNQEF